MLKLSRKSFFVSTMLVAACIVFQLVSMPTFTSAANSKIRIFLNNTQMTFGEGKNDPEPYIRNDRTLVPFRRIFEALEMEVSWESETKRVSATKSTTDMELYIGKNYAFVNNFKKEMDVAPEITDGRTFVPLRFVSENCGAEVIWDAKTRSVYINYSKGKYKLGEEATYKDLKFSVDSIEENLDDEYILVKGKTTSKDVPLVIELQDYTKRTYSKKVSVSGELVQETGKYEFTIKIFVKGDFETENINVKTYMEGNEPFKIAEYEY